MKNINNSTQWEKNGSVDVTFTHMITHQNHFVQSGRSTQSAVDIFNTLHLFTKEPIREQEIKLECIVGSWYGFNSAKRDTLASALYAQKGFTIKHIIVGL